MFTPGLTYRCWKASSSSITSMSLSLDVSCRMPWHLFLSTATVMSSPYLRFICSGSSPTVRAVALSSAITNPLVRRLYPRLSTATLALSFRSSIRYSTWGVLPVPPTVMLPTEITGTSKLSLRSMPISKSILRIFTPRP